MVVGIFAVAASGFGVVASYVLTCKDPSYTPLFLLNSSLFAFSYLSNRANLKNIKTYQSFVDFEAVINNHDEIELKKSKKIQN